MDCLSLLRKQNIKCQNHNNKFVSYFTVKSDYNNEIELEKLCSICALQQTSQQKKLLIVEELITQEEDSIVTNWPPLEDPELMMRFIKIHDDISQNIETKIKEKQIQTCFKNIKYGFIKRIEEVERITLETLSKMNMKDFMTSYNSITHKNEMKKIITNYQNEETQFQQLVKEVFLNKKKNTDIIDNIVNQFEQYQKQLDLSSIKIFFNQAYESLDQYLNNDNFSSESLQTKRLNESIKNFSPNLQSQLHSLNQQYTSFINELPLVIEDRQKYSFIVQSNQIKETFEEIINNYPDSSILSTKIKSAVAQKKVISNQIPLIIERHTIKNMIGNQYAYVDFELSQQDFGKSFGVQINNLAHWIGVGIIDKDQLIKNNFQSKGEFVEKIGYTISQNGYAWSMLKESQYKKEISFKFQTNDVLTITLNNDSILFENITTKQQFKMDFQFQSGKKYYPAFRLYHKSDEIEFV